MKKIKRYNLLLLFIIILVSLNVVNATSDNQTELDLTDEIYLENSNSVQTTDTDITEKIVNAENNATISINPGTYSISNLQITKNLTLQGNGDPREVVIDGENHANIFLITNDSVHVTFKNITFINANTDGFGGAISIETGHVYVDNCIFANNTAGVNAGGISNYGNSEYRGYLFVNNSLFINNHAEHDGGAITTCYADSDIYNTVFINNSAHRDGGAIRVSIAGYGNVEDCIFMFNHADEWGGAYYSWSGTSHINRCIFLNNTAGTNGGAVMVSGDLNLENSIIMNNTGGETGGSFYIQQPMYDAKTIINVHNNIITNNSSPYGQEIFIKWDDIGNLYTKFNNNDWGDENPNDPSVIDPNNVTSRSAVTSTIKSALLNSLNIDLLDKYNDLVKSYFPDDSLDEYKNLFNNKKTTNSDSKCENTSKSIDSEKTDILTDFKTNNTDTPESDSVNTNTSTSNAENSDNLIIAGNSTSQGDENRAYELNETGSSVAKQTNLDLRIFVIGLLTVFILLLVGYKRFEKEE